MKDKELKHIDNINMRKVSEDIVHAFAVCGQELRSIWSTNIPEDDFALHRSLL